MTDEGFELLIRLQAPMALIGEDRSRYVYIDQQRIHIKGFINDPHRSKQEIISLLKERYSTIESILLDKKVPIDERRERFLEGIAIKRAIHMVIDKDISNDLEDIERWLEFGKKIT